MSLPGSQRHRFGYLAPSAKKIARRVFAFFGLGITSIENLESLNASRADLLRIRTWEDILKVAADRDFFLPSDMSSQLGQDMFALVMSDFKRGGYFVEFGATDGVALSNTYLLESKWRWNGILAEPARRWHRNLMANRKCIVDTSCVWSRSGETLEFSEANVGEFSTISHFKNSDSHAKSRLGGLRYEVETISLLDLLIRHSAPQFIDYLSIDTEGSEWDILKDFDFSRYRFGAITCEHNYTPSRERVFRLLSPHGYVRVLQELSKFEDWYVSEDHLRGSLQLLRREERFCSPT